MAFPQVASITQFTDNTSSTSHAVTLPATVTSGDLLIIFARVSGTINSTPSGWDVFVSNATQPIYAKISDGTEGGGTATIGTSSSGTAVAQTYRITGFYGTISTGLEQGSAGPTTDSNPNPPSKNPTNWDVEDTLWITEAVLGSSTPTVSSYPSSYTGGTHNTCSSGGMATARRENATATEDPGTYTLSGSVSWVARTIAVRPSAAAEQTVTLSGLASTSALGTQSVLLNLNTTGIASTSGFGTQGILLNIDASGIASISAIGTQVLANTQILTLSGIASSSAFGTQSVLMNLNLTGIPSTSALGTQSILLNLTLSGIASTSAIGTSALGLNLTLNGISSTEAFGTGVLSYEQNVTLSGISSTTLFGLAELGNVQVVLLNGLPSTSTFGTSALFDRSFVIIAPTTGVFTQVDD